MALSDIRDPSVTLAQLYAVRDDLLTGKVQNYSLGDRNITLFNLKDLEDIIRQYENAVAAGAGPIIADLSGIVNQPPFPNG